MHDKLKILSTLTKHKNVDQSSTRMKWNSKSTQRNIWKKTKRKKRRRRRKGKGGGGGGGATVVGVDCACQSVSSAHNNMADEKVGFDDLLAKLQGLKTDFADLRYVNSVT